LGILENMPIRSDLTAEIALFVVGLCWLGFFAILIVGKRGAAKGKAKRDMKSHLGFLLQCIAYAICFGFHRVYFSPFLPMSRPAETVLAAFTIVIAMASVWFCFESARTLGKQWALVAQVIEGHELITSGPYALVRNPIYLTMFGMLLSTGLAASLWPALLVAIAVLIVGTEIRIRSEEQLLREAFGSRFDNYVRNVPALFPRVL
jgi:protein-S-isoprenylcysteine O-methyltransferase Ste14